MHYNGMKHSGICLDEQQELIEDLNPQALIKARRLVGKIGVYSKIVSQMEENS